MVALAANAGVACFSSQGNGVKVGKSNQVE